MNNYGKPKGPAKSTTEAARGGGFSPPSGREHPPSAKGQSVGGVHSAGVLHDVAKNPARPPKRK
jgi:hypothetical protein